LIQGDRPEVLCCLDVRLDTGDAIADFRWALVGLSPDRRSLTVSARFEEPTDPTGQNWWFGASLPRGITWGLNTDRASTAGSTWPSSAAPVMGAYGCVARQVGGSYQLTYRARASFDGASYRGRFPVRCIGSPQRLRFTADGQLYADGGEAIIGGDYAPAWASSPAGWPCADRLAVGSGGVVDAADGWLSG
jgi:hypothetical protein